MAMKFIKWINLVFNPQEKIELSVQEKEILSELQNEIYQNRPRPSTH